MFSPISKIRSYVIENIEQALHDVDFVHLIADGWTATNQLRSHILGLVVQYLDSNWNMITRAMSASETESSDGKSHCIVLSEYVTTGLTLASHVAQEVLAHQITDTFGAVMMDNTTVCGRTADYLASSTFDALPYEAKKDLLTSMLFNHLHEHISRAGGKPNPGELIPHRIYLGRCQAHWLQVVVLDGIQYSIDPVDRAASFCALLKRAQDLVDYLLSSDGKALLREEQALRGHPVLVPTRNVVTRWSSVVTMLVRLVR